MVIIARTATGVQTVGLYSYPDARNTLFDVSLLFSQAQLTPDVKAGDFFKDNATGKDIRLKSHGRGVTMGTPG